MKLASIASLPREHQTEGRIETTLHHAALVNATSPAANQSVIPSPLDPRLDSLANLSGQDKRGEDDKEAPP